MVKTIILLITLLLSQMASATSCENLTYEVSNIQKAQSKLKAGSEDDAEELSALEIEYDQKMAKLSMYKAIVELRDNYKRAMEELAQSKTSRLEEIKTSLQNKMLTLERMSLMSMMISDALEQRIYKSDENIHLDNIEEFADNPELFADQIWNVCEANATNGIDISKIALCRPMEQTTFATAEERIRAFKGFKRKFSKNYGKAIINFHKVYAGDDLDEETREKDLREYQRALTHNIPELELAEDGASLANFNSISFADESYLNALQEYQESDSVKALKESTTYEDIVEACEDPKNEQICNEKGQDLAVKIEDYVTYVKSFGVADKISSDFDNMFTQEIEDLKETFADSDQPITLDSLLSDEMANQLRTSLESNLNMEKLHSKLIGEELDGTKATQLARLANPDTEAHYEMYLNQLNQDGLCDSTIQTGNTKDNLLSCVGALALEDNLSTNNRSLATKIGDLEEELKEAKERIDSVKNSSRFKELERFKVVLAREAKKVCDQEDFKTDDDVVTTCMSDYLDSCMSNSMNSLTLLNGVAIELEEKIPFFSRTQSRHDDIERYCSSGSLKSLAPYSCTSIATNNQLDRTYKRYVNGKSAYGQRESFGNIFNTALSRELPNFANTYMNIRFYQPLTYDGLYYNALATKNYLYQRDEWNSYWENYWDNYDYSSSSSYYSIYNSSSTYTSIYSD